MHGSEFQDLVFNQAAFSPESVPLSKKTTHTTVDLNTLGTYDSQSPMPDYIPILKPIKSLEESKGLRVAAPFDEIVKEEDSVEESGQPRTYSR